MTRVDSPVPLMHHDPDRSWITDPDLDHPKRNAALGWFAGAHPDGHQHGGRKPTETSVTEFCYKSVNLSLEELKNIKVILF